jgi:hypothetical protein
VSAQFNDYLEQLKNLNVEIRRALERANCKSAAPTSSWRC